MIQSHSNIEKICFKCGGDPQPLSNFYKHSEMADGHLNKCIECTKKDVNKRYFRETEKIKEYEKKREQTIERKSNKLEYQRNYRKNNQDKYKARGKINNGIRNGKIIPQPCEICGDVNSEAHHEDYSKPLDVHWYCFKHHREKHGQLDQNHNRNVEAGVNES